MMNLKTNFFCFSTLASSHLMAAQTQSSVPNLTSSLVSVLFALIMVIGVILMCAWILKRVGSQSFSNEQSIEVVSSRLIGPKERLVIVRVADKTLLLGVTASSINKLQDLPEDFLPEKETSKISFQDAFSDQLAKMMGKNRDA